MNEIKIYDILDKLNVEYDVVEYEVVYIVE